MILVSPQKENYASCVCALRLISLTQKHILYCSQGSHLVLPVACVSARVCVCSTYCTAEIEERLCVFVCLCV